MHHAIHYVLQELKNSLSEDAFVPEMEENA